MEDLGTNDRHQAYLALRGTLHAVRDYLVSDEAAHLSAQLPLLVRGIFFEGWDPSKAVMDGRTRADFLRRVGAAAERALPSPPDPERMARAGLRVLSAEISAGEAAEIRRLMPDDVRALWPEATGGPLDRSRGSEATADA